MAKPRKTRTRVSPALRAERADLAKAHIGRAAAQVFARRGYTAATMQDIAKEAEYTVPSLYAYFDGKAQMFEALRQALTERFEAAFAKPLPAGLTLAQKLELLFSEFGELVLENRAAVTVFFAPGPNEAGRAANDGEHEFSATGFVIFRRLLCEWLEAQAQKAELLGQTPESAAFLLVGISYGVLWRWLSSGAAEDPRALPREVVRYFFFGIGAQPAPPMAGKAERQTRRQRGAKRS